MSGKTFFVGVRFAVVVRAITIHHFPRKAWVCAIAVGIKQCRECRACRRDQLGVERCPCWVILTESHSDKIALSGLARHGHQGLTLHVFGLGFKWVTLNEATNGGQEFSFHGNLTFQVC